MYRKNTFILLLVIIFFSACANKKNNHNQHEETSAAVEPTLFELDSLRFLDSLHVASNHLRFVLENRVSDERYRVGDEELYSSVLLPQFYVNHLFTPVWISGHDQLGLVYDMIEMISYSTYHGLVASHYHLDRLNQLMNELDQDSSKVFQPIWLTEMDMLLSDAFFMLSSHLYNGKVDPIRLKALWGIQRNKPEMVLDEKLDELISSKNLKISMGEFYPTSMEYLPLVEKAEWMSGFLKEDFQVKIPEKSLTLDVINDTLYNTQINHKLFLLGFSTVDSLNYVDSLSSFIDAIKVFQRYHGLNSDGRIGKLTLEALNTPIAERIKQLYVNMERLRWFPAKDNPQRIMVNIADFTLDYLYHNDTILHMRTVVGRDFRQTPVFNAKMTYLVFSPTWTVPPGILRNDVLPEVAKNTGYLTSKNMIVIDRSGQRVDPAKIDWQKARRGSFPYTIRQMPGDQNALGRVKFMFPNKFSVYLHDTPTKSLFARDERLFSSGCIRIEKPFQLAKALLNDSTNWSDDKIRAAMNLSNERTVILKEPVEVYIYYLTAWSQNGHIHFRKDVYSRDQEVYKALQERKK